MARLELGAANLDRDTRFNGGPAAIVAIFQTPGANAIKTLNDVRARVAELAQSFPEDMTWKVTYDPTASVTATIEQGTLFVVVQLPGGASVARTTNVVQQAEEILKTEEAVQDFISVVGLNFIDNFSQSNAAFMVVRLKPFEERKDASQGVHALIGRLGENFRQVQGGVVVPLAPPPIIGLGTGGGFSYVLEDLRGGDPKVLAQTLRGLVVAANQNPQLSRVFTTFSATNPSIYLDIDRDKAQILGVPLNAVFQALQASLGGYYVNDINLYGRRWQIQAQAEAEDRSEVDDIYRINVRNNQGKMIPLRSLVRSASSLARLL